MQALRDEGHDVVQTTVSRDVTELGLVKVRAPSGRLIYAAPGTGDADRLRAIGAAMRRYATGVEAASGGLVVVTTPSGYASALAQAIDEGGHPSIAGTLAGDNTIFIAAKDGTTARELQAELASYLADGVADDDALVGPGRRLARSPGLGVPPRRRRRAAPLRLRGEPPARPAPARRRAAVGRRARPRSRNASPRSRRTRPGYLAEDEDVHSAIERQLGDVGRKIHAGRSRNDQVAAAFRLYVLDACAEARQEIEALALVVLSFAEAEADTLLPGYTHLQRGQPVTLGHHLLAWVEMLDRDRSRFAAAAAAATESPLGAGALAGSTLGLPAPPGQMRNSIDAVADRDFALDYLYAVAVLYTHLSRIGEEIVLWSSGEFGFVRLPENAATGSSMMPQKLNPDVAELARGKAGTAIGRLTGPARDRQGAAPRLRPRPAGGQGAGLRGAGRHAARAARLAALVAGLEVDRERMAAAASDPLVLATDAAEALVGRRAVPRGARARRRERA